MLNFSELSAAGQPWRVSCQLSSLESGGTLATPSPLRRGPTSAVDRFAERKHIILLGFAYNYVAGAASVGFDLYSDDESYVPGVSNTFTIWQARSQAAGLVSQTVSGCWVELTPPDVLTTPVNGASLKYSLTGTAPTSGYLLAWGIHTSLTFGDMAYSGSPAVFPNT